MATFVDLDSILRDREIYPNPAYYQLSASQVKTWFRGARSIRSFPQDPNVRPLEFSTTVHVQYLIIPYEDEFAILPKLYVEFRSSEYKDIHLLQTIDGKHPDANFVCTFDKLQYDTNGNAVWIHYKCDTRQAMRFRRDAPITFRVTTRDGSTLPNKDTLIPEDADPLKQIMCTVEVLPYIRDAFFSNHVSDVLSGQ